MLKESRKYIACIYSVIFATSFACTNNESTIEATFSDSPIATSDTIAAKQNSIDTLLFDKLNRYINYPDSGGRWEAKKIYPKPGAILPYNRIVAYYGTPLSKRMGILGELPEDQMLARLQGELEKWRAADTLIPVKPALHYIATVAQATAGADGKYILRMPFSQIDTILRMAKRIDALVFLDIQVGLSRIEKEVPLLKKYLLMPHVHLGIDPEFSMKTGARPGTVVGSYNSDDINYVINYLQTIVKENNLPPKVLVIHRYTGPMVKNADKIKPVPEVQVVMDMDGWGKRKIKNYSYYNYIYKEPVQFAGFKVFYKNDTKEESKEMQPEEIIKYSPKPIYIQYQ